VGYSTHSIPERRYIRVAITRRSRAWWRPRVSFSRALLPYSAEAYRIIDRTSQEATSLQHNYVGTEHLLLGLLADDGAALVRKVQVKHHDNGGRTVLEALKIDPCAVRAQVEEIIGTGPGRAGDPLWYTPRAMRVVELAVRDALRAGDADIRGEHILTGLIAEGEGVAAQVLERLGASYNRVTGQLRW
jgi:ATP-dependent Clp protease ATP-binding subunit ClpC